jgi:hypothetical protein
MSRAEAYKHEKQPIIIRGHDPWNLPRTILCHENQAATTTNVVTSTRWLMPLDFGAETDEIDVARCETDGVVSIPESGTVVVSNATTTAGVCPIKGRYPVITGSSVVNSAGALGAAAFEDWTLEQVGSWGDYFVQLDKTDTGLWMVVKKPGFVISVR